MRDGAAVPLHGGPDAVGVPLHDFSTNANAAGPCPMAVAALRQADAVRYPDPGYRELRAELARLHGVAPARVVLAASASEFIFRITAAAVQAGVRAVRLPAHGYGDCARAAHAWRLPMAPGDGEAGRGPSLRWCCDPSSPLGRPEPGLAASIDALAPGTICVLDLAYEPLRLEGALGLDGAQRNRVWQLWTPNKALGLTGVRAAYAVAPVGAEAQAALVDSLAPSWPIGAHGVALLQSWTTAATRQWLEQSLATLRAWKARLVAMCEALGWHCRSSVANFFCARPGHHDVAALCAALRAQGVKLRDTASFGLGGHVRLSALPPASQDALRRAVEKIPP